LEGEVVVGGGFDCGFGLEGGHGRRSLAEKLVRWRMVQQQQVVEEVASSCGKREK
jgi:hypothetical protein